MHFCPKDEIFNVIFVSFLQITFIQFKPISKKVMWQQESDGDGEIKIKGEHMHGWKKQIRFGRPN